MVPIHNKPALYSYINNIFKIKIKDIVFGSNREFCHSLKKNIKASKYLKRIFNILILSIDEISNINVTFI